MNVHSAHDAAHELRLLLDRPWTEDHRSKMKARDRGRKPETPAKTDEGSVHEHVCARLGLRAPSQQRQPVHAPRMSEGNAKSDHRSPRETHEHRAFELERVERIHHGRRVVLERERGRDLAPSVARSIENHDPGDGREGLDLAIPHATVEEEPVQENEGRAASVVVVMPAPETRSYGRHPDQAARPSAAIFDT